MASFLDEYKSVASRIEEFYEKYPNGSIQTQMTRDESVNVGTLQEPDFIGVATFKATLFVPTDDAMRAERVLATGWGQMTTNDRDKKSVEMAETVSIGRAMANAGFATKDENGKILRPSREEMDGFADTRETKPAKSKLFKRK